MATEKGWWDTITSGLSGLMNGTGTNDAKMLALTGFGLASLADNLNRTPEPIKSPAYTPAPVYNRALTAPMRDVNSLGSKLYFNPQPFNFDPATAGTQYGPTPAEIQAATAAYRSGVASMYDNMPTKQMGAAHTPGKRFAANMQTAQGRAPSMMEMLQASRQPTENIELRPYGLGGLGVTGTLPTGGTPPPPTGGTPPPTGGTPPPPTGGTPPPPTGGTPPPPTGGTPPPPTGGTPSPPTGGTPPPPTGGTPPPPTGGTPSPSPGVTMNPIQTSLYFAYNPDVRAGYEQYKSAMTPEQYASLHYNTWGYKEERGLPPNTLDTAAAEWYYDQYPDVANAYSTYYSDMSPEEIATQHYNKYGRNEQRLLPGMTEFFAEGGEVSAAQMPWTYTQAQQYMRNNPDVLAAYQAQGAGMPLPEFAQKHFASYGSAEQRMYPSMQQRAGIVGGITQQTPMLRNTAPPANSPNSATWGTPKQSYVTSSWDRAAWEKNRAETAAKVAALNARAAAQAARNADPVAPEPLPEGYVAPPTPAPRPTWTPPMPPPPQVQQQLPPPVGQPPVSQPPVSQPPVGQSPVGQSPVGQAAPAYGLSSLGDPRYMSLQNGRWGYAEGGAVTGLAALTPLQQFMVDRGYSQAPTVKPNGQLPVTTPSPTYWHGDSLYKGTVLASSPQTRQLQADANALMNSGQLRVRSRNLPQAEAMQRAARQAVRRNDAAAMISGNGPPNWMQRMNPNFAAGGPVSGPGDGVSDSIPATINGNQPAALADGEYVLPAHFVSALGNGSTNAGVRQIQNMVDRVMAAKYRTRDATPNPINPRAVMPV